MNNTLNEELNKSIEGTNKNKSKILKIVFERIIPYILIAVFAVRLFCYQSIIPASPDKYVGLANSPISNKFLTVLTLLAVWFEYTAIFIVLLRPFFGFKTLRNLTRFIPIPIFLYNCILFKYVLTLLQGNSDFSILFVVLIIEIVLGIIISLYYNIKDRKDKIKNKEILIMLGIFLLMLIASMPSFVPQVLFGRGTGNILVMQPKKISFSHRLMLYIGVIVPFVLYFTLRNRSEEVIKFSLIYISIATMVGFLVNYDYTNFSEPWTWPFHLCNTAMFIIPLCLIFKMKRLFYFTYYINVLGAILAMLMPNYADETNILSMRIFNFWYNHWIASFMPLLIVALKVFEHPKLKQFIYSMVGFLGYFVLVLFLNVYFTAKGHSVDYFFINSDYVGDKLGTWGTKLFLLSVDVKVGDLTLTFHPLYQTLFFLVYVGLGLAVWFVYNEFFIIADNHYELHMKLKKIKLDTIAMRNTISPEREENLMIDIYYIPAHLQLLHFSKKYSTSKVYAVNDANFEVHAGEIFGFLGPNGAGKSTIIKSIVGIQPITDGDIEVCGFNVAKQPVEAKACIGYVPDHYALYEKLTGREYVNYIADIYEVPLEERNQRIEKYIQIFELQNSIDNQIKTYSHGMKQKITIMSALVHNPKVWILDEPLTGLDPTSIYQVKECMKQHAAEGNIVFFSSHLIDIVEKLCSRIAIIKHGQIQCVKTLQEIEDSGVNLEEFYLQIIKENEENY